MYVATYLVPLALTPAYIAFGGICPQHAGTHDKYFEIEVEGVGFTYTKS